MKNLFRNSAVWRKTLHDEALALFLDYEGTLSSMAPASRKAGLSSSMKKVLETLAVLPGVKVAVISGRSLRDLEKSVGVPGLFYFGSHGIETSFTAKKLHRASKGYDVLIESLRKRMISVLKDTPGVFFEDKPFSFVVHYQRAAVTAERKVRRAILDLCEYLVYQEKISVMAGDKFIEVLPPFPVDKGRSAHQFLQALGKKRFFPVVIGDDRTDEAAFALFRANGLTIKVGKDARYSLAEYYVDSVDEVEAFLRMILYLRVDLKKTRLFSKDPNRLL